MDPHERPHTHPHEHPHQHPRLAIGATVVDFARLADVAEAIAAGRLTGGIHLVNAYTLALAEERSDLADALAHGRANLPDGMPLVWWARRRGAPAAERVYGPDLMEAVLDAGRAHATRHYLYGSTPEVLDALTAAIATRWPGAEMVGVESPPFRDLSDDELRHSLAAAAAAGATVVWVGMGTPKQDLLVHRLADLAAADTAGAHPDPHEAPTAPTTFVAIGAAFDFIAGTKPQAPRWVMRIGLEWLYRLVTEPRRLWKRYLVYNVRFVRLLWRTRRR